MVEQLWAPWRLAYVTGAKPEGCVLCSKLHEADEAAALVLARSEHSYVVMNLYPYNAGHLMVVPTRHVADPTGLEAAEAADIHDMLCTSLEVVRGAMDPAAFNVGLNLGSAAGGGIPTHLHWHVVPRWNGDTNFMPVLAETKVMPQHLQTTYDLLRAGFDARAKEPTSA